MFNIVNQGKETIEVCIDDEELERHPSLDEDDWGWDANYRCFINNNQNDETRIPWCTEDDDPRPEHASSLIKGQDAEWAPEFRKMELDPGQCGTVDITTCTMSVDATIDEPLVTGTVTIEATVTDDDQ